MKSSGKCIDKITTNKQFKVTRENLCKNGESCYVTCTSELRISGGNHSRYPFHCITNIGAMPRQVYDKVVIVEQKTSVRLLLIKTRLPGEPNLMLLLQDKEEKVPTNFLALHLYGSSKVFLSRNGLLQSICKQSAP